MGTNFYAHTNVCPCCGRHESIHLGKSSGGWRFTFRLHDGEHYRNVPEMKDWLVGKQIFDEYGARIPHEKFWDMVEEKQKLVDPEPDTHTVEIGGYKFLNCEFS